MNKLRRHPPTSPYGFAHSNYALLKEFPEAQSEILHAFQQPVQPQSPSRINDRLPIRSNIRTGYIEILSCFTLAVLIAFVNHVVFSHLDGKEAGSHGDQFWVTVLKNVFLAAVALLLFMELKICLLQVALYHIRLDSYSLELVNLVTSPPSFLNLTSVLFNSSMRASAVCFAILAAITQAVTFILLFIPGTLAVVPALPHTETLTVPSIDFNGINPMKSASFHYARSDLLEGDSNITTLKFIEPSQKWRQLILQAASSHTAPSWDPPAACGFACSYSFSYLAPALNCTELSKLDIWPSGSNTSDSRLGFPLHHHHHDATQDLSNSPRYYFYNSTVGISSGEPSLPNITFPTLDIIYIPYFNSMLFQNDPETTRKAWSPRGVHCTFENATYEATAEFLNNTQRLNTRVNKWHGPLSLGPLPDLVYAGMDSTNMTMASYSIVRSFSEILQGQMFYTPRLMQFNTSDTQALYTPLFNLTSYPVKTPDLEEEEANLVLTTFSPSPSFGEDLSTGLQSLLGNVTLAFVNERMATTNVEAIVTPNSTRYQYISWKLCLVYGIVFGLSFWISVYGLFCLQKNGTLAVFDVQHILEMTVESTRMQESVGNPKVGFALVNRPLLSVRTPR